jgi:hypothetical protein
MKTVAVSVVLSLFVIACGSSNPNMVVSATVTYRPAASSDETLIASGKAGFARIFEVEDPIQAYVEAEETGQIALNRSAQKALFKWEGALPSGLDLGVWSGDGRTLLAGVHCYKDEVSGGGGFELPVEGGAYYLRTALEGVWCTNSIVKEP